MTPVPDGDVKVDILLVDDNPNNLLALEAALGDLGQNLVRATSGVEALRRLLEQDFALALLDIQMPELDGFQTAALIRARERSRHMPIIFLTAYNKSDAQISQGYELGAVDFLFKPIVPTILRAKVQAFVDLSRKTEEVKRQARLLREVELRESERRLQEAAQRWEADRLREEMIKERRLAETLARTVAERERAEVALQASNDRLRFLSEMANRLLVGERPKELLHSLYRDLSAHLHLEVYFNYLLAHDGRTLRLEAFSGVDAETAATLGTVQLGESLVGTVALTRRPLIAEDVQSSDDTALATVRKLGITSHACFPLIAQDRLLGTLSFGTRGRSAFAPDDIAVMQVVTDQVAVSLERARLIEELSLRNFDLADADRRKDEFLAMLAHELRNPMAPIVNAVHLLRLPQATGPVVQRALDAIDRQVGHMVRLVDDLLDLSRINTGKVELRKERVTLATVIEHAVQTSAPLMQKHRHEFVLSMPPDEIQLIADRTRLTQVIANLLNNAAKYSPPGGRIDLIGARDGDEVVITVRDRGIGIRPEMLDSVFGLFVQSDRTADRSQGGLGIGLTLVKSLVEMHGGSVSAHSEGLGHGSEFVVRLPLIESRSIPPPPPPPLEPSTGGRALHVMVVEDNADVRETMRDFLQLSGHEVSVAEDGPSAVEALIARRPDVALVDIGLPGLDGYQVLAALRERGAQLTTTFIALTGYGRPQDRQRAFDAGFHDHLVKPVDSDALLRLLDDIRTTPGRDSDADR
ncbi:MAG: Chemotaxis protein methyltransferase CheR [Myxococcaceae bacterium]|nr:Chemotaxis protein methyltransferase CheR [Myxococcaceae bacterium]